MKNYFLIISVLLSAFAAQSQPVPLLDVNITDVSLICYPGDCVDLSATYPALKQTTSYAVSSEAYSPSFPFFGGILIPPSADDNWSPLVNLPFSFCFYGTSYNQMLVGTNGVITFDMGNQSAGGNCQWEFLTPIPNTQFPIRNAIYGVYQDVDIRTPPVTNYEMQNVNYYVLDAGTNAAPNRVFIANFNELPQFQCDNSVGLQTSQIVLHEGTNIIEIIIHKRTSCTIWNSGNGVIGVQNQQGTLATVPPGRNTGAWSATDEAWRFTPNGSDVPTAFTWLADGVFLSNENPLTVCPTEQHVYEARVTYENCDATHTTISESAFVDILPPMPINLPANLSVCAFPGVVDLSANEPIILNGANPDDYEISFYTNFNDAQDSAANYITNTFDYSFSVNQTIYVRVQNVTTTGCAEILSFDITLNTPSAPEAEANQTFINGETLANIEISGTDIKWYSDAEATLSLPITTVLSNNQTYYATQTNGQGCESAATAVTMSNTLGTAEWNIASIKIQPNPVKDILNISSKKNITNVTIYNILGQVMLSESGNDKETKMDLSQLTTGTYIVKITADNQVKTIKVVKQ